MMGLDDDRAERFERLYAAYVERVHAYLRRRQPDAADDVTAETFAVAWRRLERAPADPLPWLLSIARLTLANELRRGRRADALWRRLVDQGAAGVAPPPVSGNPSLVAAFMALSPAEREAVALVAWDELTTVQAARVVGVSRAAFSMRLARARRRVAAHLAGSVERALIPPEGKR